MKKYTVVHKINVLGADMVTCRRVEVPGNQDLETLLFRKNVQPLLVFHGWPEQPGMPGADMLDLMPPPLTYPQRLREAVRLVTGL